MKKLGCFLFIAFTFACFSIVNAQNCSVKIGTVLTPKPGDTILIPIYVTGFRDIGAFGLKIKIDMDVLTYYKYPYSCVVNLSNAVTEGFSSYFSTENSTFSVAYTSGGIYPINVPDGKLFDMRFIYKGGTTNLCFLKGSMVGELEGKNLHPFFSCGAIINSETNCKSDFFILSDTAKYSYKFYDNSLGYQIGNWKWNFGDSIYSEEINPLHQYKKSGMYQVCLTIITYDSGKVKCSDTWCENLNVAYIKPQFDCHAYFNTQYIDSINYKFIDKSIGTNITERLWDFGDNSFSSEINPTHIYTTSGTYTVCLKVFSILNGKVSCTDSYCENIHVNVAPNKFECLATFYSAIDTIPRTYNFYGYAGGDSISGWYWDFGDSSYSKNRNPVHKFIKTGEYKVCLNINSSVNGIVTCSDTYCQTVKIDSIPNPPKNYCYNYFTYNIADTTKNSFKVRYAAYAKTNEQLLYQWNFGDGVIASSAIDTISHIYTKPGNFNVCLTSYARPDSNLCSFTSCKSIFGKLDNKFSYGSLSGQVFADSHYADKGFVAIIMLDSISSGKISYYDTAPIQSNCYYNFSYIPYGNYFVFAMLYSDSKYFSRYIPTFYGDVWDWKYAKTVLVGAPTMSSRNIHLVSLTAYKAKGAGCISGSVSSSYFSSSSNSSLSDIEVVLLDKNDKPVAYTFTDREGNYKFSNLGLSYYKIWVEKVGVKTTPAMVNLDTKTPCVENINFNIDYLNTNQANIIISVTEVEKSDKILFAELYPNPVNANESINLDVYNPQSTIYNFQFTIHNYIGQKVYEKSYKLNSGKNTYTFNISSYPKGLYFIKISGNNINTVRKFIKI